MTATHTEPCPGCEVCELAEELIEARAEAQRYRDALERHAEALHDLSDDPEHMRHPSFKDCPNYNCVRAREALGGESA